MEKTAIRINEKDNVAVALRQIEKGEAVNIGGENIAAAEIIPAGFKFALKDIKKGENIIKYGAVIGVATQDIVKGGAAHTRNIKSLLSGRLDYDIKISPPEQKISITDKTINAYVRRDGKIGVRNDIFIIPTVGCVNDICQKIADRAKRQTGYQDIYVFKHPYGCSQLGGDQLYTQLILKGLVKHPNAGGVLVVSLGCENNNLSEFTKVLGEVDEERVKFITAQKCGDEIAEGAEIVSALAQNCLKETRRAVNISRLVIGLKCGGSDALSGITANPLVGAVSEKLVSMGASVIMTEVPEMFGAEQILMSRSKDKAVYRKIIDMINGFKEYFIKHGESVSENPSPGNKEGGITTLEEKSLGCIQKGGGCVVADVINYGESVKTQGLTLLEAPGNDIVAQTALAAAGAHIILFTTGRGTPLGAAVPTIKISTNSALAENKPHWIDFDAGALLKEISLDDLSDKLLDLIVETANGKKTNNEINDYRDFAIWKNGVTL